MSRYFAAVMVVSIITVSAFAEDRKEAPILKGNWSKDVEGADLTFKFTAKDKLLAVVEYDGKSCTFTCESSIDKDGKVSAKVTDVSSKDFPDVPAKGFKFSFKFKIEKDVATLSDFEAENAGAFKTIVEGEYKKKKDG